MPGSLAPPPVRGTAFRSLAAALVACLVGGGCGSGPLRIEPVGRRPHGPALDRFHDLALRHAPILYHEVDPEAGRQDLLAAIDFDGNLRGTDNWENMARFELVPTVYYHVVETATHSFISYHVFHPRDWAPVRLGVQDTHENDGENLQVVVDRATDRVVLLFTQAHFCGGVYAGPGGPIGDGRESIRGPLELEDGRVIVFVESQGHGIYGGRGRFERGLVLHPARTADEPSPPFEGRAPYVLESLTVRIWPGVADGSLVGEDRLLDGVATYEGHPVPRYYEADRFSGPLGSDRGISPLALDFGFCEPELGSLFYDPAGRYAEVLAIEGPWATEYTHNIPLGIEGR